MNYIVVYDKKKSGNPIVAIHSQPSRKDKIELKDIHPLDDPNERGVVVVPGEIIKQMVIRKYKIDSNGNIIQKSVEQEKRKEITSIMDSSLGQNILTFGEHVIKIISIINLKGQHVNGTILDDEKGVIGIGKNSGFFTVTCIVDTGERLPEIDSEKPNWKWKRDNKRNIIGMELINKLSPGQ